MYFLFQTVAVIVDLKSYSEKSHVCDMAMIVTIQSFPRGTDITLISSDTKEYWVMIITRP